jgi:hypothetical protein
MTIHISSAEEIEPSMHSGDKSIGARPGLTSEPDRFYDKPVYPPATYKNDPDIDYNLLEFMQQTLKPSVPIATLRTKLNANVLESAQFIVDNSIDVALSREHIVMAAKAIYTSMQERSYTTETWSSHQLHPKATNGSTVEFIFTMDLLNFSFWSELDEKERFCVEYKGQRWTGYYSLVALLHRALDEGMWLYAITIWPFVMFQFLPLMKIYRDPHNLSILLG